MCFTSTASFVMAATLIGGGAYALRAAVKRDARYAALAVMPIAVGIQQLAEGLVWYAAEGGDLATMRDYGFLYLFFVWLFWPAWTGLAAAMLEPVQTLRRIMLGLGAAGVAFGLALYAPYTLHPEWMHVEVARHSLAYSNDVLLTDAVMPRDFAYMIYLGLIALPMLLSTHFQLRLFGMSLVIFVPLTYAFFLYAYLSVLCFFAALCTIHLIFIIIGNRCPAPARINAAN